MCTYVEGIWVYSNSMTLKSWLGVTEGHSKRHHSIVELFDVKYYGDFEVWVKGHSRSLELVGYHSNVWVRFPIHIL